MEHGKRQGAGGKGRSSPRSQAKRAAAMGGGGGGQYSRSPRTGQGPASAGQYQPPPPGGPGGVPPGLPGMPPGPPGPGQIPPGGMLPPAKGTGLLGVAPGHVGLLGPPPIPPGGPVGPPSQGGMMHPNAPSGQPPPPSHMMQGPQSHGSSYVVELTDLSGSLSLEEMTERIRSRGFPQSCDFVLQLLDSYFVSVMEGVTSLSTALARGNIIALTNVFVLRQSPHQLSLVPSSSESSGGGGGPPSLAPVEEAQLLLSIQSHMEGIPRLEMRYCLLDALFGGPALEAGHGLELLNKVISFAISIENGSHLACMAIWLQAHPSESLVIAKSVYHDFCVLLPDAMEPLLQLPAISPHMAFQMTKAFTTLHPFHTVGEEVAQVDMDRLHPPLKMLQIVSHWVEAYPNFLFPPPLLDQHVIPKLPLLNSANSNYQSLDFYSSISPLVGLIQWCVISPLTTGLNLYGQQKPRKGDPRSPSLKSPGIITDPFNYHPEEVVASKSSHPKDFTTLMANLHANLLSLLLSGLYQPPIQLMGKRGHILTGNDVRDIVSALLGFKEKLSSSSEQSRTVLSSLGSLMDESVERLAQFMQILLSTRLLSIKQDDELVSLTSGLPKNRLLQVVVSGNTRPTKK